jgi:DNA mismatch repair protein MutS
MTDDITPIRQQYLEIKSQYPDTIVFFRLGDFYETFDQDAETTSRELDIVLTGRNVAKGMRVPMAGIPYHAVESYLARLIHKGYHVAICEQVGEQPSKGLFPREVVRVITPGTLVEPALLPGDRNNFLLSYVYSENRAGLAFIDISTGEFSAIEFSTGDVLNHLRAEIHRISPSEYLIPDSLNPLEGAGGSQTTWPNWHFELARCEQWLRDTFHVATLEGFGLKNCNHAIQAAGAILQYLKETQPEALKNVGQIHSYSLDEFMVLDGYTRRNLELTETIRGNDKEGTLLGTLDHTITPMGHRLIAAWVNKPLLDLAAIQRRLDGVELLTKDGLLRADLRHQLRGITDLERIIARINMGTALPRDLVSMRSSLQALPNLRATIEPQIQNLPEMAQLDPCTDVCALLEQVLLEEPANTLAGTGIIRPGYSSELDGIIEASQHARDWIANLEGAERSRTGIKTLKVGYNKVFGYYIEITRANSETAPADYIRKQTLVNAERYITPELKEYETLVLNAEDRIHEIEVRLFREVCRQIAAQSFKLHQTAEAVARLDVLLSLAETAVLQNYTRPQVENSSIIQITDGRHPVVESSLQGKKYIPNDLIFEDGEIVRIITGPNMSGKSTYLRQAALIILMAQMGSFVPARQAHIGLVDRIFTRIGAQDEIHSGQSTFMVEMVETTNILQHASPRSLLILDEIGRGTSTYDGISIAWAVIEYIHNHPNLRARTLFATHYHELIQMADVFPGIRNYNVAVSEADGHVVFLHKIVAGGADRSYGIHVAQLAGLPPAVITRANEMMQEMEAASGHQYRYNPIAPQQIALFPETNPLVDELKSLDINSLSPIEALNRLYEWKKKFTS